MVCGLLGWMQKVREVKRQQHRQRREQAHAEALAAKQQAILASPRPGGEGGALQLLPLGDWQILIPCMANLVRGSEALCLAPMSSNRPAQQADVLHCSRRQAFWCLSVQCWGGSRARTQERARLRMGGTGRLPCSMHWGRG
jgi:hypothetical protein